MSDPILKRGLTRTVIGLEVSELELKLIGDANTTINSAPFTKFALDGGFDGATIEVSRHFSSAWDEPAAGNLKMFVGRVGPVTVTGSEVVISLKSMIELLDVQMPRNIYSASCSRTLYDEGCGIVAASFTAVATSLANSTRFTIHTDSNVPTGYYALGTITGNTGQNVGITRTVKKFTHEGDNEGDFVVALPFPYAPETGDTFDVKPGCDKLMTTCNSTFNNLLNFRGFPFIPAPESTL
jgi:uncharacterized phage protein (TIGR02218 family)